ncbi:MAG TPA: hypothetical protein VMA95_15340 [Streptosporangiaceae bacterium]|nr:hypothetical protein [Streptosporangiaceae bacterium]
MAKTSGGSPAALSSLLGASAGSRPAGDGGCWPARPDRSGSPGPSRRGCWPDPDDLSQGDISPADVIRKIAHWVS